MHVLDAVRKFELTPFEGEAVMPHRGDSLPPPTEVKRQRTRVCDRCGLTKPLDGFHGTSSGVLRVCKLCSESKRTGTPRIPGQPRRHARADEIEALLRAGRSQHDIMVDLRVSAETIKKIRAAAGIPVLRGRPREAKDDDDHDDEL
jgi:hypothetical protein